MIWVIWADVDDISDKIIMINVGCIDFFSDLGEIGDKG